MKNYFSGSSILRLISALLLLVALAPIDYGYYVLLRWVVCAAAVYSFFVSMGNDKTGWTWGFAIIGIIFNPFKPIHLDRSLWAIIDVASAVILFISTFTVQENWSDTSSKPPSA